MYQNAQSCRILRFYKSTCIDAQCQVDLTLGKHLVYINNYIFLGYNFIIFSLMVFLIFALFA